MKSRDLHHIIEFTSRIYDGGIFLLEIMDGRFEVQGESNGKDTTFRVKDRETLYCYFIKMSDLNYDMERMADEMIDLTNALYANPLALTSRICNNWEAKIKY